MKRRAFGLIEVLVAMAISAMVLLGAIAVSAKSLQVVKQNELKDMSSGILLRSLEISRSPAEFNLSEKQGSARQRYYTVSLDENGNYDLIVVAGLGIMDNCNENSEFRVDLPDEDVLICNQVEVTDITKPADAKIFRNFEIRSIVIYKFLNDNLTDELISYRSEVVPVTPAN
jgi:prepilin-type N-terminal cleavage/methylation domain-containing protein